MSETIRSETLQPGTRLRHKDCAVVTLDRRKSPDDDRRGLPFHPGWWLVEGGGLADFVLDNEDGDWTILPGVIGGFGSSKEHNK